MATAAASPEVVEVKRTFAAPQEKVFQAWTKPEMMSRWFARSPSMKPGKVVEADARPGGKYCVEVISQPDGKLYRLQGTYREVNPHDKLVFTWSWEGADFESSVVSVEFHKLGHSDFTEITLRHSQLPEKQREGHRTGWIGCFEMLDRALEGKAG